MSDTAVVTYDGASAPTTPSLYGTDDPREVVARATAQAEALADVLRQRRLTVSISGREYVRIEGWTLLGSMLGVLPATVWTRRVGGGADDDGWEARVEARTLDGRVVGAAEAMCTRGEPTWRSRPEYALRSMAQTRAAAKALRLPLGFVVALAGYEATPAEEMDGILPGEGSAQPVQKPTQNGGAPRMRDPDAPATQPQQRALHGLADRARVDLGAWLMDRYGVAHAGDLTKGQASEAFDALKSLQRRDHEVLAEPDPAHGPD